MKFDILKGTPRYSGVACYFNSEARQVIAGKGPGRFVRRSDAQRRLTYSSNLNSLQVIYGDRRVEFSYSGGPHRS